MKWQFRLIISHVYKNWDSVGAGLTSFLILLLSLGSLFTFKRPLIPWPDFQCCLFLSRRPFDDSHPPSASPFDHLNCVLAVIDLPPPNEVWIHKRSLWYAAQSWHNTCWCLWHQQKWMCFDTICELLFSQLVTNTLLLMHQKYKWGLWARKFVWASHVPGN